MESQESCMDESAPSSSTRSERNPLYAQAANEIRRRITGGAYPPASRLPTQTEFAKELGVSQITIRRAISELVEEGLLMSRPGSGTYVMSADTEPQSTTTQDVACIFEDVADGYPLVKPVVKAIGEQCRRLSYGLRMIELPGVLASWEEVAERLSRPIAGALMFSPMSVHLLSLLQRRAIPYVVMQNEVADGISHSVTTNYVAATILACRRLIDRGCRRLVIVTPSAFRYSTGQMEVGVHALRQLRAADHPNDQVHIEVVHDDYMGRGLFKQLERWRDPTARPDSLFLTGDAMVEIAMFGLSQMGLRVPEDVAIIEYGNTQASRDHEITCIDRNDGRLGETAMAVLDQLIKRGTPPMRSVIQPELIVRKSA